MSQRPQFIKAKKIIINDDAYDLKFTLASIFDFEQESGKNFLQVIKPIFDVIINISDDLKNIDTQERTGLIALRDFLASGEISGIDIATLFWASIGGTKSKLTVRDAAEFVTIDNVIEVFQALFGAISESMPLSDGQPSSESKDPNSESSTG